MNMRIDADGYPVLENPNIATGAMGPFEWMRRVRDNGISAYPESTHERPFALRKVGFRTFVLLNDPEFIQHVLLNNKQNYIKGRLNRQILGPVLGDGLLTSEGDSWRRRRKISAPAFHNDRLVLFAKIMSRECDVLLDRWRKTSPNEAIDISKEMMGLTMRIVTRSLFSHDVGNDYDELGDAISTMIDTLGKPSVLDLVGLPEWLPRRRSSSLRRAMTSIDRLIYQIIDTRRRSKENYGDLLDMLMDFRDLETGDQMSDKELRDEIITLFAAGHETTAVALSWAWYLLFLHPEEEKQLIRELRSVLGGRKPEFDDLQRLPYCRMVFEETMRLYPPAFAFQRMALNEDRVGPHVIPAGAEVTLSPWVTHRNPKLWQKPKRFDPNRFKPEEIRKRHKYAYFPFGGGPRICIGNGFSMVEGCIVLATILPHFDLNLVDDCVVTPQGRITLRPRNGMQMYVLPRA